MRLTSAIVVVGGIGAAALVLRLDPRGAGLPGATPEALPLLFIAAFLCVAVLLRSRAPSGAWLATAGAGGLAAIEVLGSVRAIEAGAGVETWPWLVAVAEVALIAAAAVAAAYATKGAADSRPRQARWWRVLVFGVFVVVVALGVATFVLALLGEVSAATASGDAGAGELSWLRISRRLASGYIAAAVLAGIWRDVSPPVARALARADGRADVLRALGEELLPRAATFRDRGREEERARLAADLHALVLPDLRRATRTAEAAGDVGQPLASELRHAVQGVERLMHERQSVVFEEFGLIAALEWLAERTQDQAQIDVDVRLDDSTDNPDSLPKAATRAAFRVAILAVDNVVRHAGASRIELDLRTGGGALALSIVDDGHGLPASHGSGRDHGRGLVDMRAAARATAASIDVRSSPEGTTVEFRWSGGPTAAGNHPTTGGRPADGPSASQP